MAQSVPQEVIARALRNAPPDQQAPPKFGTWAWRSINIGGPSSTVKKGYPVYNYAPFPRYIFLEGGSNPDLNNLFYINRTVSLTATPNYIPVYNPFLGLGEWSINTPIPPVTGWNIRRTGTLAYSTTNFTTTALPYLGLNGYENGTNIYTWTPPPSAPRVIRGLPESTLDLPSLSVTVSIDQDYVYRNCGVDWNIKDSFKDAVFVWNPVNGSFTNNRSFPLNAFIKPCVYASTGGGFDTRFWLIWGGAACSLYTNMWGASGILPSPDDPIFGNRELGETFTWQGVNSGMPAVELRILNS